MVCEPKKSVFTPLGRGSVVYVLPDGGLVVEFEHGSGHIFRPEELGVRLSEFVRKDIFSPK